jgi:hypothetical protein
VEFALHLDEFGLRRLGDLGPSFAVEDEPAAAQHRERGDAPELQKRDPLKPLRPEERRHLLP